MSIKEDTEHADIEFRKIEELLLSLFSTHHCGEGRAGAVFDGVNRAEANPIY